MSTKIHEAWRWPILSGLSSMLYEIETIMKRQIHAKAQELIGKVGGAETADKHSIIMICSRLTQFQALNPYKGPQGDMSCDFCFFDFEGHYYMFPVGSINNWDYTELYALPRVEDFRYWDNTDAPDDVSEWEWEKRRSTWDSIHASKHGLARAIYHVLDPYFPTHDLMVLFDPRWATAEEKERYDMGE